jgi:hypothetical protein
MKASQSAVTLISSRIDPPARRLVAFCRIAHGATGLLQMLAVGESTTCREVIDLRKAEAARLERVDGWREVAYAG